MKNIFIKELAHSSIESASTVAREKQSYNLNTMDINDFDMKYEHVLRAILEPKIGVTLFGRCSDYQELLTARHQYNDNPLLFNKQLGKVMCMLELTAYIILEKDEFGSKNYYTATDFLDKALLLELSDEFTPEDYLSMINEFICKVLPL